MKLKKKTVGGYNHDKYITTPEFNTFTTETFAARLAQGNLVTKADFDAKVMKLDKKINSNKTRWNLLVGNEFKKLQTFDSSYYQSKNNFEEDGTQDYLVFQPRDKYFEKISNTGHISEWKSKTLSDEVINSTATVDGSCLKQDKITYIRGAIVNIYTVYKINSTLNSFDPTLENGLFGSVKLTKNTDIKKCKYSGYDIGFDSKGTFMFSNSQFACNVIIFGADMSSSVHVDNKIKDILILGEDPNQGVDGTTLTAEKKYSIKFTKARKKFCLSLHCNNYLFVNDTEIIKL